MMGNLRGGISVGINSRRQNYFSTAVDKDCRIISDK